MRIALAQINPVVGDIDGNTRKLLDAMAAARRDGADVVVTCELAVLGYPPRDLLLREGVASDCMEAVETLASQTDDITLIVGHPRPVDSPTGLWRNSASVCQRGSIIATYDKQLLPGYDVFDEDRYFEPGNEPCVVDVKGTALGILICEDLWQADDADTGRRYTVDPLQQLIDHDCDAIITLNASPFVMGKHERHCRHLSASARRAQKPLVAVHQLGANDDLIFDGRSMVFDANGHLIGACEPWVESVVTIDLVASNAIEFPAIDPMEDLFNALTLGVRDYVTKTGHRSVVLGLSGGIDSALTAVIAAAAIGPENVRGILMPSRFSSEGSISDANELVQRLRITQTDSASIHAAHDAIANTVRGIIGVPAQGITDENIQARTRGILLMAVSNATGCLVLSTSNKSESAVGYTTLYGDMCGAIAPIADVLKTTVYELSRWINAHHERCGFHTPPIPVDSIEKPPSAELRPDQTDQDSLPPYEQLDDIIRRFVEHEQSVERIIEESGLEADMVHRFTRLIDREQYKRDQASVILKVSPRTFGRGRPMPMAMRTTTVFAETGTATPAPAKPVD